MAFSIRCSSSCSCFRNRLSSFSLPDCDYILPNIFPSVLTQASVDVGYAILMAAGLSFLGLGAQPPQLEWGLLITQARVSFLYSWWTILSPGIALFVTVVLFNYLGDSLREYYDPRLSKK